MQKKKKKAKKKKKKGTHLIERSVSERVVELPRPTARERCRICFQRIVLCWGYPDFYLGNVGQCFLLVLPVSSPSFFSFFFFFSFFLIYKKNKIKIASLVRVVDLNYKSLLLVSKLI
jgi:hypothetical protein